MRSDTIKMGPRPWVGEKIDTIFGVCQVVLEKFTYYL